MRMCPRCDKPQPETNFYLRKGKPAGWCKECMRKSYWDNAETRKAAMRKRHHENAEEINAAKRRARRDDPERFWAYELAKFKLTPDLYNEMLSSQDGICAICATPCKTGRKLAIDHDHSCCARAGRSCGKCLRGLLCNDCNNGLGRFRDDPEILMAAARYILEWREKAI